jgi:hypothetical protein
MTMMMAVPAMTVVVMMPTNIHHNLCVRGFGERSGEN